MTRFRKFGIVLLALMFLSSLAMAARTLLDYADANRSYSDAAKLAGAPDLFDDTPVLPAESETQPLSTPAAEIILPDEPSENRILDSYAQDLFSIDLEALRRINPDVIGWILIPETNISYPLVQGTDNDYYLNHTWEGKSSFAGSIFLESLNSADLQDHNTILYGHNLKNGTMFTQLHNFKQPSFPDKHRHIYIITSGDVRRYEVFAAYEAPVNGPTYWLDVNTDDRKQQLIEEAIQLNTLDTGITPTTEEKILTLSTCTGYTYDRRWVVKARFEGFVIQDRELPEVKHLQISAE